jgi:hypothetical protein
VKGRLVAHKLADLTHQKIIGDVQESEDDMQKGMLENYSSGELVNRIVDDALNGEVIIEKDPIPW